jgi:hypothetical protein
MIEEKDSSPGPNRRDFLGQLSGAAATLAAGAVTVSSVAAAPASGASTPAGIVPPPVNRLGKATNLRMSEALQDAAAGAAINVNNGDDAHYPDKGGSFTKGLPHNQWGQVDPNAYGSFKTALAKGGFSYFEKIMTGGVRTLNGPQGGLCFDLEVKDNVQFGQPQVPPAPTVAGPQTGTELLELYWASLLRDVAFTDYDSSSLAAMAAQELGGLPSSWYTGPRDASGHVTPGLLFRGGFPGETLGPYLSQLFLLPTYMGAQPISQQQVTYLPNINYMTSFSDWLAVQNGNYTGALNQTDAVLRYRRNGRDLSAWTHVDVLLQEYLTAYLVLSNLLAPLNPGLPFDPSIDPSAPLNPGNPYLNSKTENGFGTLGQPDISTTLAEVVTKALNAVWYQKWWVHLRLRPEAAGGIVSINKGYPQGAETDIRMHDVILNSVGLQQSYQANNQSWLLSQAFPEGSPMHPAYPTGHGTVGGACVTVLKFFFDGSFVIPNPVVPASDGLSLAPYTGTDANQLTVNGELNKLGHNITFGHGLHPGIHWRSDSDFSMILGEAVAISMLQHKAAAYNEPFTVKLTKFDGTTVTISNRGNP